MATADRARRAEVRTASAVIVGVVLATATWSSSCNGSSGGDRGGVTEEGTEVSRGEYGEEWPLTAEAGVLRCEGDSAITIEVDGKRYAVNSTAQSSTPYATVDDVRAPVGGGPGLKNLGPLIDRGLELCPGR